MNAQKYLFDLIATNSVSCFSNRSVVNYAQSALQQARWGTREVVYFDQAGNEKVNLIAAPPAQNVTASDVELAFVCHTDTVPFSETWAAALKPFADDDFVYGCGACDVKGFLACLLEAATTPAGEWLQGLRIVLTADEEVGCVGAKHLLSTAAIRCRRLVIGEPTSLRVARAGKGYCVAEVVLTGVEAHSAHPDQGASAIYAASRMIARIAQLAETLKEQTHDLFSPPYTTLNVGTIQGGTAKNIVARECTFLVEWRPIPGLPATFIPNKLEQFASEIEAEDARMSSAVRILRQQAGFETAEQSSLVQTLIEATGEAATSIPFGSEASILAPLAEEIIVIGPGDMRTAHSNRERVPLLELTRTVNIMRRLMTRDASVRASN